MNIREYNFSIPGTIDRHIPGIPGIFPAGSLVQVDEDTMQVLCVVEGVTPLPLSESEKLVEVGQTNQSPPAQETPAEELQTIETKLADIVQHLH